jgi:sigma-B regulation protein RsbQ
MTARESPAAPPPSSRSDVLGRHCVTVRGDGPVTLLLAHGFGCDQRMWRHVAADLERDHRVVTFDYVGHGRSRREAYDPLRYSSLEGHARDVLQICAALDLEGAVFVGHSVSSMIGALASIAEPARFARLVMVGPSPRYVDDPPHYAGGFTAADIDGLLELMDRNYIGWANFLAPVIVQNGEHPEFAGELEQSFCSTDPVMARQFAELTFRGDNRADLPRVPVPTLVLQCSDDRIAPTAVGEYVAQELPDARLHMLAATGHCPHLSHPAETIAAIRAFLAEPLGRRTESCSTR